jgi:hypothetical protein
LASSAGSGNSANTGVVVLNLFSPSQGV